MQPRTDAVAMFDDGELLEALKIIYMIVEGTDPDDPQHVRLGFGAIQGLCVLSLRRAEGGDQ